jgi:hypothetical protein
METGAREQNSRTVAGEITYVAEAQHAVVVVPVVLEVAEIELEVTVRVVVHVRHPVVAVSVLSWCARRIIYSTGENTSPPLYFIRSLIYSRMRRTDGYDFSRRLARTHKAYPMRSCPFFLAGIRWQEAVAACPNLSSVFSVYKKPLVCTRGLNLRDTSEQELIQWSECPSAIHRHRSTTRSRRRTSRTRSRRD